MASTRTSTRKRNRVLDARPDTADFRDRMFEPTLVDVPATMPLSRHLRLRVPVLDQGEEGACTAFGLATVAHTLLCTRGSGASRTQVSTRMLYNMARRYDEWRGEDYSGSSCRGAMKGWHHHGVCSERLWPYPSDGKNEVYTEGRARDATLRPLGAYFRVNHKDLVAMHAAFAEVKVLYASCAVHVDWKRPPASGKIGWKQQDIAGYHAFAIVGYDERGFWIQNSWGRGWGRGGFGHISYDEWLERGTDVWVARLAVPVQLRLAESTAVSHSPMARESTGYSQADLRPHVVSIGNDGRLREGGRFGNTAENLRNLIENDLPRITRNWKKKRVLLYAHGGLVPEQTAIQRVADYRERMLEHEIFPLCFIWRSDFWTTLGNVLREAGRGRAEGVLDKAKDFLIDRVDDMLEPLARPLGKVLWDEMKENALCATTREKLPGAAGQGGATQVTRLLDQWMARDSKVELHVAAHSAGSILMAPLVQLLTRPGQIIGGPAAGMTGLNRRIESLNLWAPAITTELFLDAYAPALRSKAINRAALFTLTDEAENDDHCAGIYNKSLLYLVAHAFEARARSWFTSAHRHGTPILGMAKFIEDPDVGSAVVRQLISSGLLDWIKAPTSGLPDGSPDASGATSHGVFDDDRATLAATVARILGQPSAKVKFDIHRSEAGVSDRRERIARAFARA